MIELTKAIRNILINNASITALVSSNDIHPKHITAIPEVSFPCITLCRISGGERSDKLGKDLHYQIDVWTKDGFDELWDIYNLIEIALNKKHKDITDSNVTVTEAIETTVEDNLYEQDTQLHHLAARYKFVVRKK
jgi:hypothetical protein